MNDRSLHYLLFVDIKVGRCLVGCTKDKGPNRYPTKVCRFLRLLDLTIPYA